MIVLEPAPFSVHQRRGFDPLHAHAANPGGPRLGSARVRLVIRGAGGATSFRLSLGPGQWLRIEAHASGSDAVGEVEMPAGGWYRGALVALGANGSDAVSAGVGPFGVGEVFVVAGQSYAGNWNDERQRVADPEGRVAALNPRGGWAVAHDPQPMVAEDSGTQGSIWPGVMDLLVPLLGVPIGMVNVSVSATATRQWLPGTPLFRNLESAVRTLGDYRAVLWQHGESDVMESLSADEYVRRLESIRGELVARSGVDRPWLPAKSTLHPTVYSQPAREAEIRGAVDRLWRRPGFRPGPDTDILGGESRSDLQGSRHFSSLGDRKSVV